jgi:uncharacterized protein (TIGR00369 family)
VRTLDDVRSLLTIGTFPSNIGIELDSCEPGRCVMRVSMRPFLKQTHDLMHGGVLATLADTAVALALYPELPYDRELVTTTLTMTYLAPVRAGRAAIAEARVLRRGTRSAAASVDVRDDQGTPVAAALVTYAIVRAPERAIRSDVDGA